MTCLKARVRNWHLYCRYHSARWNFYFFVVNLSVKKTKVFWSRKGLYKLTLFHWPLKSICATFTSTNSKLIELIRESIFYWSYHILSTCESFVLLWLLSVVLYPSMSSVKPMDYLVWETEFVKDSWKTNPFIYKTKAKDLLWLFFVGHISIFDYVSNAFWLLVFIKRHNYTTHLLISQLLFHSFSCSLSTCDSLLNYNLLMILLLTNATVMKKWTLRRK